MTRTATKKEKPAVCTRCAHALSSREEVAVDILLQLFDRFVSHQTRRPLPGPLTPAMLPAPEVRRRD